MQGKGPTYYTITLTPWLVNFMLYKLYVIQVLWENDHRWLSILIKSIYMSFVSSWFLTLMPKQGGTLRERVFQGRNKFKRRILRITKHFCRQTGWEVADEKMKFVAHMIHVSKLNTCMLSADAYCAHINMLSSSPFLRYVPSSFMLPTFHFGICIGAPSTFGKA